MKTRIHHLLTMAGTVGLLLAPPALMASNADTPDGKRAPLFEGLGNYHHSISTKSALAQRYFDQGLTLCYAFNHTEAIRSFRGALAEDPECAMAYWGIAYAYGPHVNKPMSEEDNVQAWAAVRKALALKSKASAKEQAFIDAMADRYQEAFVEDRSALDRAFAESMRQVVSRYPDDLDAQTIFAEALMDTMPWDYWASDRSPKPETEEAFAALRLVLKRNPDHPGANHLYIHAVEAGPNPELGLPAADSLAQNGPRAGHLVHMPSHIYIRVGRYRDATEANERSVEADLAYIQSCRAQGFYPGVYYPHNVHFLWYANMFEGRSAEALRAAKQAAQIAVDSYCGPSKAYEAPRFRHLPWLTWARFGQWDAVLGVERPPSTNDFLIDRVMWHFTRGLASSARRDVNQAVIEHEQMMELIQSEEAQELDSPILPATGILAVADHFLAGKIAAARGDRRDAIAHLEQAVAAEDALPYMEPAFWPFPTRPALGAAFLEAGDASQAERVFREDLERQPRNGWGLLGLEQSLRAQGRTESAAIVRREFEKSWERADVDLELAWF
jgi:tetratricopeptide (TPR) repeat protein